MKFSSLKPIGIFFLSSVFFLPIAFAQSIDLGNGAPTINGAPFDPDYYDHGCGKGYTDSAACNQSSSSQSYTPPFAPTYQAPTSESNPLDNLQSPNLNVITNTIDLMMNSFKVLQARGYAVFFPLNKDSRGNAICKETNSQQLLNLFCTCNEGYIYSAQNDSCVEGKSLYSVTQELTKNDVTLHQRRDQFGVGSDLACKDIQYLINQYQREYFGDQNSGSAASSMQNEQGVLPLVQKYIEKMNSDYNEQCKKGSAAMTSAAPAQLPSDVPADAWYRDALVFLIGKGFITSNEVGWLSPKSAMSKASFIIMIVDSKGGLKDPSPAQASFDDVPVGSVEFPYFEEAAKNGWMKGVGNCYGRHPCNADPEFILNRAEAAALLVRIFTLKETESAPKFNDVVSTAWYADPIQTAASHCILTGDADKGTVRPNDVLNGGEMAVMLQRAMGNLAYPNCQ